MKYLRLLYSCMHVTLRDLETISSSKATKAWNLSKARLLTHLCQENHLSGCFPVKLRVWFPTVCIINVYTREIFKQWCRNCLWQRSVRLSKRAAWSTALSGLPEAGKLILHSHEVITCVIEVALSWEFLVRKICIWYGVPEYGNP